MCVLTPPLTTHLPALAFAVFCRIQPLSVQLGPGTVGNILMYRTLTIHMPLSVLSLRLRLRRTPFAHNHAAAVSTAGVWHSGQHL